MLTGERYKAAAQKIGLVVSFYWTIESESDEFVVRAMEWLAKQHKDLHVEFLEGDGWHVGLCKTAEGWDDWVSGDGSLVSALLVAVERTRIG